jgi:hypothetical protein
LCRSSSPVDSKCKSREGQEVPEAIAAPDTSAEPEVEADVVSQPAPAIDTAPVRAEQEKQAVPVTPLSSVEAEPNGDFDSATAMEIGAAMNGLLSEGDIDVFRLRTLPGAGDQLSVNLRLEDAPAVAKLRIYDGRREGKVDAMPTDLGSGHSTEFLAEANAEYFVEIEGVQDTRYSVVVSGQ